MKLWTRRYFAIGWFPNCPYWGWKKHSNCWTLEFGYLHLRIGGW